MTTTEDIEKGRLSEREFLGELCEDPVAQHGPGSFGEHEARDRSNMVLEIFHDYVMRHPSVVMDKSAYHMAHRIMDEMVELYQYLGTRENWLDGQD